MVGKLVARARDLGAALVRWVAGAALVAAATGAWGSTITYFHNDLAGSPVAATNSSGQVVWRESYRPYGERLVNSASAKDNDVWFTSRRQDSSGLVYMGARYYDPLAGRFASTDPRGFDEASVQGFNRYAYANDNPYRYVDPDGQVGVDIIFVALDAYSIVTEGPTALNVAAAGLDVASTFGLGFGAGQLLKGAAAAERASEIYRGSELARNMAAAGNPVEKGVEEAHHIVAQNAKAAEPARKILAEHGIDINSAENGAAMSRMRHRKTHTNEYYQGLNEGLTEANQGERAAENVKGVLGDYRRQLEKP